MNRRSELKFSVPTAVAATVVAVASMTAGCSSNGSSLAVDPVAKAPNRSWISVSGQVVSAGDDAFVLDYGTGKITVEMDDWDSYSEGRPILEEDRVIVYGFVDDDFYERRTIEASSVYVKGLGTQFYASGVDEEDFIFAPVAVIDPTVEMTGTIVGTTGRRFTLDTSAGNVVVDTDSMPYNPMDDEGYQQLDTGDRVRVSGKIEDSLFNRDLEARIITVLQSPDTTTSGAPS